MDFPIHWDVIRRRLRGYALPLFLFLAMAIGGATRSIPISIALLQVVSCGILAWVVFDGSLNKLRPRAWAIVFIFLAFLGYAILQLIPLPNALWTQLPGRDEVANAFDLIGAAPRAMPISLTPQVSFAALLQLVPAVAIFLLAAKLRWSEMSRHVEWSIPLVACISVFIGLAQIQYPEVDALYVRNEAVRRQALGLMQVVNHNATLMLVSIPFLALAAKRLAIRFAIGDPDHAASIFVALMFATITVGVVATGSVAGYLLAPPTMFLSLLVLQSQQNGMAFKVLSLFAASLITIIVFLVVNNPNLSGIGVTDLSQSPLSRLSIYENTFEAIKDYLPWGTGIGSFGSIYPSYENLDEITQAFVASAHNEYLEIALELGIVGVLVMIAGLIWIGWSSVVAWRATETEGGPLRRAASIACLVVIAHCLVDSPIRTQTIACVFAYGLGVLATAGRRKPQRETSTDIMGYE